MGHQLWVKIPHAFSVPSIHCTEQEMVAAIFKYYRNIFFKIKLIVRPIRWKKKSLSASTRWLLISWIFPLKSYWDIGTLSIHSRWSLIAGTAEDRFYCISIFWGQIWSQLEIICLERRTISIQNGDILQSAIKCHCCISIKTSIVFIRLTHKTHKNIQEA